MQKKYCYLLCLLLSMLYDSKLLAQDVHGMNEYLYTYSFCQGETPASLPDPPPLQMPCYGENCEITLIDVEAGWVSVNGEEAFPPTQTTEYQIMYFPPPCPAPDCELSEDPAFEEALRIYSEGLAQYEGQLALVEIKDCSQGGSSNIERVITICKGDSALLTGVETLIECPCDRSNIGIVECFPFPQPSHWSSEDGDRLCERCTDYVVAPKRTTRYIHEIPTFPCPPIQSGNGPQGPQPPVHPQDITTSILVIVEDDCNIDGGGTGTEEDIVREYPWLAGLVDFNNCNGEKIDVYQSGNFSFINIETSNSSRLYFEDGTFYCESSSNFDCLAAYKLSNASTSWSCNNSGGCDCIEIFDPVCGADGITYSNSCKAACAGVAVVNEGECGIDNPLTCDFLSRATFPDDLCGTCISEIAIYEYKGESYLVSLGSNDDGQGATCADALTTVTNCNTGEVFCMNGGIAGFDQCRDFFNEAIKREVVVERDSCVNVGIAVTEPCQDVAGVNFGFCRTNMGYAIVDGQCTLVTGCRDFIIDNVDYKPAFFPTAELCAQSCSNTGIGESVFEEYPWLSRLIDPANCNGIKADVYQSGNFAFINIEDGRTSRLYFQDGTFYCESSSNFNCLDAYGLSDVSSSWSCNDSTNCTCDDIYEPVCGIDGITYGNACEAACVGVEVASKGECGSSQGHCPILNNVDLLNDLCGTCIDEIALYEYQGNTYLVNLASNDCADGLTTVTNCNNEEIFCMSGGIAGFNQCDRFFAEAKKIQTLVKKGDCNPLPCLCPPVLDPVCGVDGNTYSNACEAECAGVEILQKGECTNTTTTCDLLTVIDLDPNLCEQGLREIAVYTLEGKSFLVYLGSGIFISDVPDVVIDCDTGEEYCHTITEGVEGNCGDFFTRATKTQVILTLGEEPHLPVCGVDGVTYENVCFAQAAGVEIANKGECNPISTCDCIDISDPVCGVDGNTYFNACLAECAGVEVVSKGECGGTSTCDCEETHNPVCGVDGNTYFNACLAECAGVEIAANGGDCFDAVATPCHDLAGVDFGDCEAVMGVAVVNGTCVTVSGCLDFIIGGIDYTEAFFPSVEICQESCTDGGGNQNGGNGTTTCDLLSRIKLNPDLCEQGLREIAVYTLKDRSFLVYFGNETVIADIPDVVIDCDTGEEYCHTASEGLEDSCEDFFNLAIKTEIVLTLGEDAHLPVCGVDGVTYNNVCFAQFAGVEVASQGECGGTSNCVCPEIYSPVCGVDGNTYSNTCEAECAGVEIASEGECGGISTCDCDGVYAPVCGVDGNTYSNACEAECAGVEIASEGECGGSSCVCNKIYDPVCGVDGKTYSNACEAECAGVEIAANGICFDAVATPCHDLAGVDFGLCDAVMGVAVVNGTCVTVSGCLDFIIGGIDYTEAFFPTVEMCAQSCPNMETGEGVFEAYPWLSSLIDPNNCNGEKVDIYQNDTYAFINIADDNSSRLYFEDGTFYCQSSSNFDCLSAYGLSNVTTSWSCGNEVRQDDCSNPAELDWVVELQIQTCTDAIYLIEYNGMPSIYVSTRCEYLDASNNLYACTGELICSIGGFHPPGSGCDLKEIEEQLNENNLIWKAACECNFVTPILVCGSDGKTYPSECDAACAGVDIIGYGGCDDIIDCICPQVIDPVCGADGKTYDNACLAECVGVDIIGNGECTDSSDCICPLIIDPVCDADGNTYDNACLAHCAGVEIVSSGGCNNILSETTTERANDKLEDSNDAINVFPNPTEGRFQIQVQASNNAQQLKVIDLYGRAVLETTIQPETSNQTIDVDLSGMGDGVYMIILQEKRKKPTRKKVIKNQL